MSKPVILCVDDERIILDSLKSQLSQHLGNDYLLEVAESGEEALEILTELDNEKVEVPLVIVDQIMGGMYGDELLLHIKPIYPEAMSIMLTGQASAEAVGNAFNQTGLFRYISKPWDENDLLLTVQTALHSYQNTKELAFKKSYQAAIRQIMQLALEPIPFEDQISQALEIILFSENFKSLRRGSIYIAEDESTEIILVSQLNDGLTKTHHQDVLGQDKQVRILTDSENHRYYRAPIILRGQALGYIYLYIDDRHTHTSPLEEFLVTVCHVLAGIVRLAQYNQALERHNERLEELVAERTGQLNIALRKQEELNDILLNANKQFDHFATTDELTGLNNRRYFFELAEAKAAEASRIKQPSILVMIDVDRFKEVNDTFGHQAGDKLLHKISGIIDNNLREQDILGRVGGEEFAIMMPKTSIEEGVALCETIRQAIAETNVEIDDQAIQISASMGLTQIKPEESSTNYALIRADHALYESKYKGRNLISVA